MDGNNDRNRERGHFDSRGFGRAPVRGSTFDRGGYEGEPMSGRDYPGGQGDDFIGSRGRGYNRAAYDVQAGYEPGGYGDTSRAGTGTDYAEVARSYGFDLGDEDAYDREDGDRFRERGSGAGRGGTAWNAPGPHRGRGPKGYSRSDDRIREDVCERLAEHGQIDASQMEVQVENGEVTLTGTVDSRRTKRLAEDVAESVAGVRDVHNHLRIQGSEGR